MKLEINETIFEIRYKPNPKMLDSRGVWAKKIVEHMRLSEWQIAENRVDAFAKDQFERAFVSFRNAGFTRKNASSKSDFFDRAIKFYECLAGLEGFEENPFIERIGVRFRFCCGSEKSFEDLKNRYAAKYLCLTEEAKKLLNGELLDIGGPLNFKDKIGNFNTNSGPMEKHQIETFFQGWDETPAVGLYFDVDYWIKPAKQMKPSEISSCIRTFASSSWEKYDDIKKLLLED